MKPMKSTSQKAQQYIQGYRRSYHDRLADCYGTYSYAKGRAQAELLEQMNNTGGHGFRIISFCRMFFTCGWMTADGNLRVETPSYSYLITLD